MTCRESEIGPIKCLGNHGDLSTLLSLVVLLTRFISQLGNIFNALRELQMLSSQVTKCLQANNLPTSESTKISIVQPSATVHMFSSIFLVTFDTIAWTGDILLSFFFYFQIWSTWAVGFHNYVMACTKTPFCPHCFLLII